MSSEVRLGFIGAGAIAQGALAPAAHAAEGVVVRAAAARDVARAEKLQPEKAYDDYAALLADDDVDLVYIALDNGGHLPWTLAALEAGKHVLCEKPLALTPADLARMEAAAGFAGRLLVEAFWYRWHPRTRRLDEIVAEGVLGPLTRVDTDFTFAGPAEADPAQQFRYDPARGGGALYDVGCYALSAAHLALGPLEAISGTARRGPTGVDLEGSGLFRSVTGAQASIRCGISGADRQQIAVTGEAARLDFSAPAFTSIFAASSLTIRTGDGSERVEEFAPVDPYKRMIEAVAARVRGEDAFLPGPEHSRQVAASTAALLGLWS
jgi:D-xylose 1-dehydrogenase (NADP+, D-xylono-1,5-lactone-forming)